VGRAWYNDTAVLELDDHRRGGPRATAADQRGQLVGESDRHGGEN
jgi:hypothetical protein